MGTYLGGRPSLTPPAKHRSASYFPLHEDVAKELGDLGGIDADAHAGRALLREVKGVVLTDRHFLAVASAAVGRSVYT